MKTAFNKTGSSVVAALALGLSAFGAKGDAGILINPGNMSPYSKTHVSATLYTKPDETASGGIRGKLDQVPSKVLGVMAIFEQFPEISALGDVEGGAAAKNQRNVNEDMKIPVYLASLGEGGTFSLSGLPPGKYDLFVMCENCFYEGICLSREASTLTADDIASIKTKVKESNPFFNVKDQYRMEGATGSYGRARIIDQEVRTLPVTLQSAEVMKNIQIRSVKLCMFESVGGARVGTKWELKKSREITRQELGPPETKGVIPGYHVKELQGVRVSTRVKDVGTVSLAPDKTAGKTE
jgi:hypothetical protein